MKLLIALTGLLAFAIYAVSLAGKFGIQKETAYLIVYLVFAVWIVALLVTLVRWILRKRAEAAKNAAPPDPAVVALKARVADVKATLAHLERHQRRTARTAPLFAAKYTPPWLALLGQPGHGKTFLLGPTSTSRLVEVDRDGVRQTASDAPADDRPRCFSAPGHAVYLEIPHALARDDAMRPSWHAMLKLLRRRADQPLHGVVVTVSAEDLATHSGPAHATQLGDDLSRQLTDLQQHLSVQVPVFLVITKIDRIAGFHDLLGGVDPKSQALGFELPDGRSDELILKELRARFDALCTALDRRALKAVSKFGEPDHAVQPRLMTFPRQLAELQDELSALAKALLAARGGDPPRLRGVYFTSVVQSEAAIAPVLDALLRGAGGGAYAADTGRPASERRYFADELMNTVWPRDASLATRTPKARRRRAAVRYGLSGASVLAAAYVGFTGTTVADNNRKLAQDTVDVSGRIVTQLGGERRVPIGTADLEKLGDLLRSWEDEGEADAAEVRGWGLFPGDAVVPRLRGFFRQTVLRGVLEPLHTRTAVELQDFLSRYEARDRLPETADWNAGHDALRFYLLLSEPKQPGEHRPIADDRTILINQIRDRWKDAARASVTPREHAVMERLATQFADLAEDADFKFKREPALVDAVREILLRDIPEDAEVQEVIDRVSNKEDVPKISMRQLAGVPSVENDNTDVRGAFTAVGWNYVKVEFAELNRGKEWVLGLGEQRANELKQKRGRNLRNLYFQAYVKEWQRFIQRTRIVSPTNLDRAKEIFGEVMRGPKRPLDKVFRKVQENVFLKDDFNYGDAGLFGLGDKKKGAGGSMRAEDVARNFTRILEFTVPPPGKEAEVPLDQYHTHMRTLHDGVGKALEAKEEEKALIDSLKTAIADTESLIANGSLEDWTKDTDELLVTPLKDLLKLLERESGEGAKNDWCARIVEPMYERFAGRYPFDPESRDDVVLADFEEFFHPENGVIRKAREELLGGWVTRSGNYYEMRDLGKGDVSRLDPGVVKFLNRAVDIGAVMFPNEELRVDFDIVLVCNPQVSRVEFKVAGDLREFTCDNKQLPRLRWPGKEGQGASLVARGRQGNKKLEETGEWGLFELLERWSKMPENRGEALDFVFDLTQFGLGNLEVRIKPIRNRGGTAFFGLPNGDKKFLSLIRASDVLPPKRLFTNRGGC